MPEETAPQTEAVPDPKNTAALETGAGGVSPSPNTPSEKSEEAKQPVPRRYKVDDEEVDEETLFASHRTRKEAEKLKREAERLARAHEQVLRRIPENPRDAFIEIYSGKLGSRQAAEQVWLELCQAETVKAWEEANLPPAERQAKTEKEELERLRRRNKELEEKEAAAQREHEEAVALRTNAMAIQKVFDAKKLAVTDESFDAVISKMLALQAAGFDESVEETAKEALEYHLEDQKKQRLALAKTFSLDELLSVKPELVKEVNDAVLAKARAAKSTPPQRQASPKEPELQRDERGLTRKKPISVTQF